MEPVRSLLYVPANRQDWIEAAPDNDADAYIFDLEDAVPLDEKERARAVLREMLPTFDPEDGVMTVRVNPPDSGLMAADLDAIVGAGVDAIVLPKLPAPGPIERADHVLDYLEAVRGIDDAIEIVALPETAAGFRRVYEVCTASDRVCGIVGATSKGADVQRALGFRWTPEGTEKRHYLSKVVLDGRAAGLDQLFSGPWHDVDDREGLRAEARMARQLGYTGYQVIHPEQIAPINEIFVPDEADVERCRDLLASIERAQVDAGRGAIRHQGEMVDIAHIRQAEAVLERARAFGID